MAHANDPAPVARRPDDTASHHDTRRLDQESTARVQVVDREPVRTVYPGEALAEDNRHLTRDVEPHHEPEVVTRHHEPEVVTRRHEAYESRPFAEPHYEVRNVENDRVRWGSIWAGLFTTVTSMLLLGIAGVAIGLASVDPNAAAQGGITPEAGLAAGIWGGVAAVIAFFLGGYLAGRSAAVFSRGWGAVNGALVFVVAIPVMLLLATMGLGGLLGSLGNLVPNVNPAAIAPAGGMPSVDVAATTAAVRDGAWGTLIGAILALGAAAAGGAAGARRGVSPVRVESQHA